MSPSVIAAMCTAILHHLFSMGLQWSPSQAISSTIDTYSTYPVHVHVHLNLRWCGVEDLLAEQALAICMQ